MKTPSNTLTDLAYDILSASIEFEGGLSDAIPRIESIEKAEFALRLMRAVAEGKKRIVIDIAHNAKG